MTSLTNRNRRLIDNDHLLMREDKESVGTTAEDRAVWGKEQENRDEMVALYKMLGGKERISSSFRSHCSYKSEI
jgi:hypothetical protein